MQRKMPLAREPRYQYLVPQFVITVLLIYLGVTIIGFPAGFYLGVVIFLAYSFGSRAILVRHHKAGILLVQDRRWEDALPYFRRSQEFFEKYPWIDRYRPLVLMSYSGASYHEMAFLNQAICLLHLDRSSEAKALYEHVLVLYPDSPLAQTALKAMDAGEETNSQ